MYYYMLKGLSIYPSAWNILIINKISSSMPNANLKYVSVDSSEYGGTGTSIFDAVPSSSTRWQTDRNLGLPHYLIFSSDKLINDISINSGAGGYVLKDFEIYISPTLLSYTSTSWKKKLTATIPANSDGVTRTFTIINDKFLIKQGIAYYTIKPEYYETGAKTYSPITLSGGITPNTTDIATFGFEEVSNLFVLTTINGETFKPIDKLYQTFDLKKYTPK